MKKNLTVKVGKREIKLNKELLDSQDCWDDLESIKDCHRQKLEIYNEIEKEEDPEKLHDLSENIRNIEFELQELWGFEKNANFHKFWDTEKCKCPSMDNDDAYPHGRYIVNHNCPLHGIIG